MQVGVYYIASNVSNSNIYTTNQEFIKQLTIKSGIELVLSQLENLSSF